MKGYFDSFKENIQKFSLYIKNHNLLVRYKERKKGISRTLFAWTLVGFTGISFGYAIEETHIPGPIALFYQSLCVLLFLFLKCLFNDGFSALKVVEKVAFDPQHVTVSQRRWSITIRGTLGVLAGAAFEYSKIFSSIVDNSTLFGADALVVALLMRFLLKEKLGGRWLWISITFLGILTIFYSDFQSLNLGNSVSGAFFGAFSTVCFAIVFLMTSYMVHHDKPITIAFYQGVAAIVYSLLYLSGSLIFLMLKNDVNQIQEYLYFFKIENLQELPIVFLLLGGAAYGWALTLFFESFYFTETLILASLGYFLAPILSIYEFLFYGNAKTTWINKWSIMLVTLGTAGLLWYEKMTKRKDGLYVIPGEESPQENLYSIISDYKNGKINKFFYLSHMYDYNRILYSFSDLIVNSQLKEISITRNGVDFIIENPNILIKDDISIRCPVFEIINFGGYETEINNFLKSILKNGDTILDIGAGTGWYALNLAVEFKKSTIYAFEPIKDLFNILSNNISSNNIKNIKAFNYGISNKTEKQVFHYVKNQHEYLKNILHPLDEECEVKELNQVIGELYLSEINFVKQELKIKEQPFILGNEKILKEYLPMLMFSFREYWDDELVKGFHAKTLFLKEFGYEKLIFNEDSNKKNLEEKHFFYFLPNKHTHINTLINLENTI